MTSSRSRWVGVAVLLLISAVCARLGVWQLSRLHQRRVVNAAILRSRAEPPISLDAPGARDSASLAYRRVTATGRYDRGRELVLRGQAYMGTPGVYVVTPLRLQESDTALLVLRGFVPAADAVRADLRALDEPGELSVTGLAEPIGSGGGQPLVVEGSSTWARLDLPALRGTLPYPILPVALLQTPDSGANITQLIPSRVLHRHALPPRFSLRPQAGARPFSARRRSKTPSFGASPPRQLSLL